MPHAKIGTFRLTRFCLLSITLTALTLSAAAAQWGDLLYTVEGSTEVTITGYAGTGGPLTLPPSIIGLPVTRIGDKAFFMRGEVTGTLTVPDSVISIGRQAFQGCVHLTGLTLGSGVREIQSVAFAECPGLSGTLVIPDNVTEIGEAAFAYCTGLTGNVSIPDNVQTVQLGLFGGCENLSSVMIGSGVTQLGEKVFSECPKLTGVCFKGAAPGVHPLTFEGTSATVCYVAGQPGWGAASFGGRPTAVWTAMALFDAGSGNASYGSKVYNAGNAFGELPTAARLFYAFAGWRTDKSDFNSVVTVDSHVPYAIGLFQLYATWALPVQKVTLEPMYKKSPMPILPDLTVTYGKAYGDQLGDLVRSGYTFHGWHLNEDGSGDKIESSSLVKTLSNHTLYAAWSANTYTATFDAQGGVTPSDSKRVLYDEPYGALPGSCRLGYAFGGWWTGVDGTGEHVTESSVMKKPAGHTLYAKWTYDPHAAQSAPAGVAVSLPLPATFSGATGITVKGLPSGLKYDTTTKTVTGAPTQLGTFAVTVSASGAIEPLTFTFTVEPLPAWAYGAFSGIHFGPGVASMTVSSQGKVSGKLSFAGTNFTFSATSYASGGNPVTGFRLLAPVKSGKTELPLELLIKPEPSPAPQTLSLAQGYVQSGPIQHTLALWRDIWTDVPATLAPYVGYYTATLSGCAEYGSGYLTFTVDQAGKVKTAGKLADGTAVSLSGTLVLTKQGQIGAILYVSPAAYKGGHLFGVAGLSKLPTGKAYLVETNNTSVTWLSRNPQATSELQKNGFDRELKVSGGWYDKIGNLRTYYGNKGFYSGADAGAPAPLLTVGNAKYPATRWSPGGVAVTVVTNKAGVMTGLTAPKAGVPTDADKDGIWDYTAENVVGLKIGLTRATGIFKGSFKAWFDTGTTHTSKPLSYEGALTPVRQDTGDGIAGRGFFLWPDKAVPPAPAKPYAFTWSYDFLLWCQ